MIRGDRGVVGPLPAGGIGIRREAIAVVAAAAGFAVAFGAFDGSGVAAFDFDHPRAVPTMLGVLLLVGASVLADLHARSQPAGTARRQWRAATVLLAILAGEQLLSLRG